MRYKKTKRKMTNHNKQHKRQSQIAKKIISGVYTFTDKGIS